ncbi:DNA-processing protein DprA [Calderihabitans maritimus]|uniref:Rossmann fold nucleotide-binding protein n=1 Tax=Calderihabitans maritimus TaxID=1246530 RepID=A0A1Z5HXT2_9FIRM|nr:DNA-processing protein DprA [Calderihabitans maritimus]GAW94332.1 Rossmann fold nucleotide-binding protein [Calderihabitans maritimus]
MDKNIYWLALIQTPMVGPRTLLKLVRHLGNPQRVWEANRKELEQVPEIPPAVVENIVVRRRSLDLQREWDRLQEYQVRLITIDDEDYPVNLKRIYDPPPVLFVKGTIKKEDEQAIAIVGSRRATAYGRKVAQKLAQELVLNGFCVVSGMARGIDTCAHQGALQGGGRTIAVLGSGINVVYPRENDQLMESISENGAVISEFPLDTQPEPGNFPVRNRIISGLAWGTLVVEATERSGSLITVDFALEQGRDVFAVPGPITSPCSKGTNNLIKQGAKLVETVADILEEYGIKPFFSGEDRKGNISLDKIEKEVLQLVSSEPVHVDELQKLTGLSISRLNSILMFLELKGLVRQLPGKYYLASG